MAVTLTFTRPVNYNLSFYEVGQASSETTALTVVASGTDIGSFPSWITQVSYSGANTFWYSVRFGTDDGSYTAWSSRMYGRYGAGGGYFLVQPSGSDWVYLVPPQISGVVPTWLEYNSEYTVTIDCSGLYASGTNYMLSDYEFTFTSEYCPLWSTMESVRLTVGPLIDNIPDDTINRMIHKASHQAITRFLIGTNDFGCSYTDVPEPLYRWVTCAAGTMALNAAISSSTGFGNTSKKLGQFAVTYDALAGTKPAEIRKNLSDCMEEASISIQALQGTLSMYAVKSLENSYLRHPMRDPQWGRHPRKVDQSVQGPWRGATNDIQTYEATDVITSDEVTVPSGAIILI
ncbi:MAG TPA: hypothetical protein VI911_11035 [Patescibacteria group bacterium]|nr:hypothetical protein [Patescibacteria group bacterium]